MGYERRPLCRRLVLALAVTLGGCGVANGQTLRDDLNKITTLEQARVRLLRLRNQGTISQEEMMRLAQEMEPRLRGGVMDALKVNDTGKSLSGIERGGSNPIKGRGIFSDEDLQTKTIKQYEDLMAEAVKKGYHIEESGPYRYKIKELDTIVWKPTEATHGALMKEVGASGTVKKVPRGTKIEGVEVGPNGELPADLPRAKQREILEQLGKSGQPLEVELNGETLTLQGPTKADGIAIKRAMAQRYAEDPEVAFAARPGVKPGPSDALEAVLENYTKGGRALFEDLQGLTPENAEMHLLAAAKDVWRSMKAAGLCDRDLAGLCLKLDAVRRMNQPVSALDFGGVAETQARLRELQAQAFQKGQKVFQNQVDLLERWRRDPATAGDPYYARRIEELEAQIDRMAVRFEELAREYPSFVEEVGQSTIDFWKQQMNRARKLRAAGKGAAPGVNPALTILLDAAVFYQCVDEARRESASERVSTAALTKCFGLAAGVHLATLAVEKAVEAGMFEAVALMLPGVGIVATATLVVVGAAVVTIGVVHMLMDIYEILGSIKSQFDAYLSDRALAAAQAHNAEQFELRLLQEQLVVAKTLRELHMLRDALMKHIDALMKDETDLATSLKVGRVRLLQLTQQLKQRMVPACDALAQSVVSGSDVSAAEGDADQIEVTLKNAAALAAGCGHADALAKAATASQQAGALMQDLERRLAAARSAALVSAGRRSAVQAELPTFAQASNLWNRLNASLPEAERLRESFAPLHDDVEQLNDDLTIRVGELNVRFEAFLDAFPADVLERPANADRLARMKADIVDMKPIDAARLAALRKTTDEVGITMVQLIRGEAIDFQRLFRELGACSQRESDEGPLDRIDTARTLGTLAMSKLGGAYRRSAFVCQQKLAGGSPAAGAAATADPTPSAADGGPDRVKADAIKRALDRAKNAGRVKDADQADADAHDKADRDEADARGKERKKRIDDFQRIARQTIAALASPPPLPPPPPPPPAPPANNTLPPAPAPVTKASHIQPGPSPTPAPAPAPPRDPFIGDWTCTLSKTARDDGATTNSVNRARWYITQFQNGDYYVMLRDPNYIAPDHMLGRAQSRKLHIEILDGHIEGLVNKKLNAMYQETFDIERSNEKLMGTYRFVYLDGRKGSAEGALACAPR